MSSLVESLHIMKRVKEGTEALRSHIGECTRAMIDGNISAFVAKYEEKQFSASSTVSSSNLHPSNPRTHPFGFHFSLRPIHIYVVLILFISPLQLWKSCYNRYLMTAW